MKKKLLVNFLPITIVTLLCLITHPQKTQAGSLPDSFADLVEDLSPAVVNISTTQKVSSKRNRQFHHFQFPPGSPFEQFQEFFEQLDPEKFNNEATPEFNENEEDEYTEEAQSLGSGFIISKDGYIVTNNHVIANADEITVTFSDDSKAQATVVGRDKKTDLALLKVEKEEKLPFVEFGNSDKARVGDWVIAIGNPFGLGGSVSAGIISARARDINAGPFDDFIQTDAAINKGNSGGPLFNAEGYVIGINTAIYSPSGGNVGIGFAMPSALAEPVIEQLIEHGRTFRGWLGVKIQTVTDEIAEGLGLKDEKGALVAEVTPNSPADKAGLKAGDVILSFDGKEVTTMRKLPRFVADTDIGKKVKVVIWRKNTKDKLYVTIGELDEETAKKEAIKESKKQSNDVKSETHLGMKVTTLDKKLRKKFSVKEEQNGVVIIAVDPKSDAASKGIKRGDIITAANQQDVESLNDLVKAIEKVKSKKRNSILLLVNRNGESIFIALKLH